MIIRREDRKFIRQQIQPLNKSIEEIYADLMQYKKTNCPSYTSESNADFGNVVLWNVSVLSRWLGDLMEVVQDNSYLISARTRKSIINLCQLIDYQLSERGASSVSVTFNLESGHPEFTIPTGTKVGTLEKPDLSSIIFETTTDQVCTVGTTSVNIDCIHGETISNEILGSSDNSQFQEFALSRSPVVWQSETIEVLNVNIWEEWTRVDSFIDSTGIDKHYKTIVDEDGITNILFGDGEYGMIPQRGSNNIRASYRIGGGTEGNVAAESITELITSVDYVDSVINSSAASGGTERETIEHAKIFAPSSVKTLSRVLNKWDAELICESYVSSSFGSIAQAKAVEIGGQLVSIMILPASGGYPSTEFRSELQSYLSDRKVVCSIFQVVDPTYQAIDIAATVWIVDGYAISEVIAAVRLALVSYLSPIYQEPETGLYPHDFGRNIYISDLYRIIDSVDGVDNCNIAIPVSDIIIDEVKIADVGDIILTGKKNNGDTEYLNVKADRSRYSGKPTVNLS